MYTMRLGRKVTQCNQVLADKPKKKSCMQCLVIFSNGGTGDCQIGHESPRKISREFPYVVQNLLRDIQLLISLCGTKFTPRHPIAQPQRF